MLFPRRLVKSFGAVALVAANTYALVMFFTVYRQQVEKRAVSEDSPSTIRIAATSARASVEPLDVTVGVPLERRAASLRRRCEAENQTAPLDFNKLPSGEWPWIYVSRKYKLLYCQTPKVGTTNWLKIFAEMDSKLNSSAEKANVHGIRLELLSYLKPKEREHVLRNYTKFLVARDPFERALSAFRDKFEWRSELKGPMFRKLAKNIVERYRTSNHSVKRSDDRRLPLMPHFGEFLRFLVDPQGGGIETHYSEPRHWQPQHRLCYPCNVDYDYVLQLDNIVAEADFLLRKVGVPGEIKYPEGGSQKGLYDEMMKAYYGAVDPRLVNAVYHYYEMDYRLFGFSPPPQF